MRTTTPFLEAVKRDRLASGGADYRECPQRIEASSMPDLFRVKVYQHDWRASLVEGLQVCGACGRIRPRPIGGPF